MEQIYIIAEIGSNWKKFENAEQNFNLACDQIDVAKISGADAVKFQLFTQKELYGKEIEKSGYELPKSWIPRLHEHCKKRKIDFMCSAFSVAGFKYVNEHVNIHKIASPEACYRPLIQAVQAMANSIIISNGCLTFEEQEEVVKSELWGADDVLMECVSNYPASPLDYNFSACVLLAKKHRILWGISDHTLSNYAALHAKRLGATYFEKHVDFVKTSYKKTPDSCVSIDRYDFEKYVQMLRKSQDVVYDERKKNSKNKYGRKSTGFRPHG
jgi:N,N'-diacetyllegionaminate synthase